jgi:hypothetical protein
MAVENERVTADIAVLEAMADEMDAYLMSDVLFWPMKQGGLPMLTLGGYLMRQHRLLAIRDSLAEVEQERLNAAVARFNEALTEKIVRFEKKAHQELPARLRQWGEYLRDVETGTGANSAHYGAAVETRAMIAALIDKLQMAPYELGEGIVQRVVMLDNNLRRRWQTGEFVWPAVWEPAYPRLSYWWLYGRPK